MSQGIDVMRRIIREKEPVRPSTRFATLNGEELTITAKRRSTDAPKLISLLKGDLDWIVMKCLEKDRTRRYETANGLAADLRRHLNNEPISARPPSRLYELHKTIQRHKLGFAAAGAVAIALVVGLSVALVSYFNERSARAGEARHRNIAEEKTRLAQANADAAAASELKAQRLLYAADMNLAQQALSLDNVGRARELLDRHRPKPGEPDLRSWEWRYLWQQCRSGAMALLTKRDNVRAFSTSVSHDDRWLAVGYFDGQVELWDVATRRLAKVIQQPFDQRAHVAFSPTAAILAANMAGNAVTAYDVSSGTTTTLCKVIGYVRDLSFSPDGEWLAVLSADPWLVRVLRAADGSSVMNYPLPGGGGMHFNNVRLSPDKARLYVSCGAFVEPRVRCVSVSDGRLLWEIDDAEPEGGRGENWKDTGFSAMALSPDGRTLVLGTGYGQPFVRILDAGNGRLVKVLHGHGSWICDLAFSSDGRWLASASCDQTLRVWDSATWTPQGNPLRGHNQEVHAVAFARDARRLFSGSKDGEVLLWDVQASRPENGRQPLPAHVLQAFALPIGQTLIGRTTNNTWSLFDLVSFHEQSVPPAEISSQNNLPRIFPTKWRYPGKAPDTSRLGYEAGWKEPVFSPDRKLVAVASERGFVGLYDATSLGLIDVLRGDVSAVFAVTFSPDSQRLVLASGGAHSVEIWDVVTRQPVISLSSPKSLLYYIEFTGDGNVLLAESTEQGRDGSSRCQSWRAPSWDEINGAERLGGLWPRTEVIPAAPPPPSLAETKSRLESHYRKQLAASTGPSAGNAAHRGEAQVQLADFLHGQGRSTEAQSLLRELLADLRQQHFDDETAVISVTRKSLDVALSVEQAGDGAGDATIVSKRRQETESLVGELLVLLEKSSARNPDDTLLSLKVGVVLSWFGREDAHQAISRRLMDESELKPDNPNAEERAVKVWCMRRAADPDLTERALRLARHAAKLEGDRGQRAWYLQTLGMAEYRAGNQTAAEQMLLRCEETAKEYATRNARLQPYIEGPARLFRAMILFRRGQETEARQLFAEAVSQMPPLPVDDRQVLINGADQDDLVFWIAYREAKALLRM
jgi:WD40 repeat protein